MDGKQTINWEEKIEQWRNSGKSQKNFCADEGLSYWTFKNRLYKKKQIGFVKITKKKKTSFPGMESIELVIDHRIAVTLCNGYSRDLFRMILADIGIA